MSSIAVDVSGTIDVSSPEAVCEAVLQIFERRYPLADLQLIERIYTDFAALYCGHLEGFLACDTQYHDIQHVLDVTLAMARLIDGYEQSHPKPEQLGVELALTGIIVALFHDSGYIRRQGEDDIKHGAEYTKVHVSRSALFMADYLPSIGCQERVLLCGKLVHFTGYELAPSEIELDDPKQAVIGGLVGTADVIAQMADPAYLEKCRDRLFPEFVLGGMTKQLLADGSEQVLYSSAEDLLLKTPEFIKNTITHRLNGYFDGLYRYVEVHFGGPNLYMQALEKNCHHLEKLIARNDPSLLSSSKLTP